MRVPFGVLMKNYPSNRVVSRDTLFQQIGCDDLIKIPATAIPARSASVWR